MTKTFILWSQNQQFRPRSHGKHHDLDTQNCTAPEPYSWQSSTGYLYLLHRFDPVNPIKSFLTLCTLHVVLFLLHTHTHLTAVCLGLPGWAGTRKVKPIWILLKQETVSGSGIRWAICKSAPRSRQITTPAPHHSVFYRPDALLAAQPTASVYWRHHCSYCYCCIWCKCKLSCTCSRQIGQWPSSV